MPTMDLAFVRKAVHSPKFKSLWLVIGLAAALVPLMLIWRYLGSHLAGGDGMMYQTLSAHIYNLDSGVQLSATIRWRGHGILANR